MDYPKCSGRAISLLVFVPIMLTAQQNVIVSLRNWTPPRYWHPNHGERQTAARTSPHTPGPDLQLSGDAASADALTFVALTPCRLVDTRGSGGGFNGDAPFSGPSLTAGQTVTFPVQSASEATDNTTPAPCGAIPAIAQAYSFNVTVIPHAAGAVDYLSIWQAGAPQPVVSTLNDLQGQIVANAAIVPAGTPSGGISVYNSGPSTTDVVIDMNGFYAAPTDLSGNTAIGSGTLASNTTGSNNTASGYLALSSNTTGESNTANGYLSLASNTTGESSTANGGYALQSNTTGDNNTASGFFALADNTTGSNNTACGHTALADNTSGNNNTAIGQGALAGNSTGGNNTSIGQGALSGNNTGSFNIAIGQAAANNIPTNISNSIYIGSQGSGTDANGTVRIGTSGLQTSFFAAGVSGVTTGLGDAVPLVIDSNGQLGTMVSSERYKEDIQDMGDASDGLLLLRPVTFRYLQAYRDGSKPLDYGLIAEDVAEVYPDLVVRSKDGSIQTVQYQKLTPMLLNEIQKQHAALQEQNETIRQLQARLAALEASVSRPPTTSTTSGQ